MSLRLLVPSAILGSAFACGGNSSSSRTSPSIDAITHAGTGRPLVVRRDSWFDALADLFDEEQHLSARPTFDPETLLLQTDEASWIARAMRNLPDRSHQLLVLRELKGLSYRELADVMEIPKGTVVSSLSRAREALRCALDREPTPPRTAEKTHVREQEVDAVLV